MCIDGDPFIPLRTPEDIVSQPLVSDWLYMYFLQPAWGNCLSSIIRSDY